LSDNASMGSRKKKRSGGAESRAVVSHFDGTWTDRLGARCLGIASEDGVLRLMLEMRRRRGKPAPAKRDALETLVATNIPPARWSAPTALRSRPADRPPPSTARCYAAAGTRCERNRAQLFSQGNCSA